MVASGLHVMTDMYPFTTELSDRNILSGNHTIIPPNINNNTIKITTNKDVTTNCIGEFYRGTKIFLTGATGFVGKALLEKLLRTCDALDSVHILMRPKRGLAIEQRLKELLKNPVSVFSLLASLMDTINFSFLINCSRVLFELKS